VLSSAADYQTLARKMRARRGRVTRGSFKPNMQSCVGAPNMDKATGMRFCSLLLGIGMFIAVGFAACRQSQSEDRERAFASVFELSRATTERVATVKRLAALPDERSRSMLLEIATSPRLETPVRVEAIEGLRNGDNGPASDALARLLQPHVPLSVRVAVAGYLRAHSCKWNCALSILHYSERISRGEKNREDLAPGTTLAGAFVEDQGRVTKDLEEALKRNKGFTLAVLMQVYGLGSTTPSLFAVETVTRLSLVEACSELENPFGIVQPPTSVRDAVSAAKAKLGCGAEAK